MTAKRPKSDPEVIIWGPKSDPEVIILVLESISSDVAAGFCTPRGGQNGIQKPYKLTPERPKSDTEVIIVVLESISSNVAAGFFPPRGGQNGTQMS